MTTITRRPLAWIFTLSALILFFSPSDALSQFDERRHKTEAERQLYFSNLKNQGLVTRWSDDRERIYVDEGKWASMTKYQKKIFVKKHAAWLKSYRMQLYSKYGIPTTKPKFYFLKSQDMSTLLENWNVGIFSAQSGKRIPHELFFQGLSVNENELKPDNFHGSPEVQKLETDTEYRTYFYKLRSQGLVVKWSPDRKRIYVKENKWNRLLSYEKKELTQKHKRWYEFSRIRYSTPSREVAKYYLGDSEVGVYGADSDKKLACITRQGYKTY